MKTEQRISNEITRVAAAQADYFLRQAETASSETLAEFYQELAWGFSRCNPENYDERGDYRGPGADRK